MSDTRTQMALVRTARLEDVEAVVGAVRSLLLELTSDPPDLQAMQDVARRTIEQPGSGVVLVAEDGDALVGVLAASWQAAIHVPGPYALIQDLWVDPAWRSRAVGGDLLRALCELARQRGMARVEVGLPRESFARFARTEAFYLGNGFAANGPRMRLVLS